MLTMQFYEIVLVVQRECALWMLQLLMLLNTVARYTQAHYASRGFIGACMSILQLYQCRML